MGSQTVAFQGITPFARCCLGASLLLLASGCGKRAGTPQEDAYRLTRAVAANDLATVKSLIKHGVPVNARNGEGNTALHEAALSGRRTISQFLIDKGADVNVFNKFGRTPLYYWAKHEDRLDMVRLLISRGADVNAKREEGDETALHAAVWYGNVKMVEFLVAQGADVNATDAEGHTPLHKAVGQSNMGSLGQQIAELLVAHGADVDAGRGKYTPLCAAAGAGLRQSVEFLLSKGADINAGHSPVTPLHEAAEGRDPNLVEFLIAKGADVNAGADTGDTPLVRAIRSSRLNRDSIVELLMAKGARVDTRTADGKTPLWEAFQNRHSGIARKLIEAGASIAIPNVKHYSTPLFAATQWGDVALVRLLLDKGADIRSVNEYGETALHQAILSQNGNREAVVELLLAGGADVNARAKDGRTPLFFAERANPPVPELVDLLRKAGAQETKKLPK